MTPEQIDTVPRPSGCVCTWEQGDSDCPVHVQCSECGADISHQAVVRKLREVTARADAMAWVCEAARAYRDLRRGMHTNGPQYTLACRETQTALDAAIDSLAAIEDPT